MSAPWRLAPKGKVNVQRKRYVPRSTLRAMSDKMRALFEADPDDTTGDAKAGCKLIHEMEDILEAVTKQTGAE